MKKKKYRLGKAQYGRIEVQRFERFLKGQKVSVNVIRGKRLTQREKMTLMLDSLEKKGIDVDIPEEFKIEKVGD